MASSSSRSDPDISPIENTPSTQPTSCDDEPAPTNSRSRKVTKVSSRPSSSRSRPVRANSRTKKVVYTLSDDDNDQDDDDEYQASDIEAGPSKIKSSDDEDDLIQNFGEEVQEETETPQKRKPRRVSKPKAKKPKLSYQERTNLALWKHHPSLKNVYEDLAAAEDYQPKLRPEPPGMTIKLLPFQKEGLDWLIRQEKSIYNGGILADEMGMGKTIQSIALFLSDTDRKDPILVIAPTVAIMQWRNEINAHTGEKMSMLIFHGSNRTNSVEEFSKYDIVLTTYATISSVYRKQQTGFKRKNGVFKEASVLHKVQFHRVVLDEAHNIKDRNSLTAKAIYQLKTYKRWCLTGTPLQNRIGEMYSLLKFLKVEPFCEFFCKNCTCRSYTWNFEGNYCKECNHSYMSHVSFFNHSLLRVLHNGDSAGAMNNLRLVLKQVMLRRTKVERADDLGLPPRVAEVKRYFFNEEETDVYSSIYSDSMRAFSTYVAQGVVLNNYANIFSLITRMRQMADHPDLVLRRHVDVAAEQNTFVCQLCDDEAEEAIRSKCHHTFCRMCIKEYCEGWVGDEKDLKCPVCHVSLTIDLTAPALEVDNEIIKKGSIINRIKMNGNWRSSTKIEALVDELYKLRSDKQTIKSIVFSQFTSMLDLVEWRLNRAGFQTVKLQGSMSPSQRDSIIKHFMQTPSVEIFLVSLKAGGVALNLCEASQVFILDPWWNPSVEWQSGDRVHRIGQHRPVKITRLIIEDSIESRIVELQEKKASMIQATIGNDDAAMNRLTPADMQFLFVNS